MFRWNKQYNEIRKESDTKPYSIQRLDGSNYSYYYLEGTNERKLSKLIRNWFIDKSKTRKVKYCFDFIF